MKRLLIVLTISFLMITAGCIIDPTPPGPLMICKTYYDTGPCTNGSYIQVCIAEDLSSCGYKVNGRMYYCAGCDPINCDSAAYSAVVSCYGYRTNNLTSGKVLEEQDVIEVAVEDLLYMMEEMKEAE